MGWGIWVKQYISRVRPDEVPEKIEDARADLADVRMLVLALAMTPVRPPNEGETQLDVVRDYVRAFNNLLDEHTEADTLLSRLECYAADPDDAVVDE